jgi:outer membrane protein assembly factor BamD (BamD/ComL family)
MRNRWGLIAIAASFVLFSFTFINWYNANQQFNSTSLAMSTYHKSNNIANLRSNTGIQTTLSAGLDALQQEDYSKAIEEFITISNDSEYYTDAQVLLSNTYFLNNELANAQISLQPLLSSNNTMIKEKAEWLQLLILLKEGKKTSPEFKETLNKIILNSNHSFFYEAKNLEGVLGNFWVGFVN